MVLTLSGLGCTLESLLCSAGESEACELAGGLSSHF